MTHKKPFTQIERVVTFQQVLKLQKHKCAICGVKHGSLAVRNAKGEYSELDQHEAKYLSKVGVTLTKVFLKMIDNEINEDRQDIINYTALCPHHSQLALRDKIRAIKANAVMPKYRLDETSVTIFKNFIFNNFAHVATTRQIIQLLLLIEKFEENEN